MHRISIPLLLLLAAALPATAEDLVCGTRPEVIERDAAHARWSEAKQLGLSGKGAIAPDLSTRDNVILLRADEYNSPFRNPIDLEGKSVTFTPRGEDGFSAVTGPLALGDVIGAQQTFTNGSGNVARAVYTLTQFELPFFGSRVKTLYIAANNAIWLEEPKTNGLDQYGDVELAAIRQPVIAPLLTTTATQAGPSSVLVNETADAATITWTGVDPARPYRVQATLFRDGRIRFSYEQVANVRAGGVLLTSGKEAWRSARVQLGTARDTVADVSAPHLDIESATVNRIAGLNLLEVQITLAQPIDRTKISNAATYVVALGQQETLAYVVRANGADTYTLPVFGTTDASPAASFDGRTITLHLLQDHLATGGARTVRVFTVNGTSGAAVDSVLFTALVDAPRGTVRTDFSIAGAETIAARPVAEAFTLSPISVYAAWEQIKASYRLKDADWDAVAIYQNFLTDLALYAGAYSTGGNPGVTGIGQGSSGAQSGLTPALMHMNMIGYNVNRDVTMAARVAMHELGHRWLYFLKFRDGSTTSTMLNPAGAHPAQYVDTRAAFPVYGPDDSSVMGGGTFRDAADGSYKTTPAAAFSYSWHDLYLMGLAAPSEVPPWWYLANSQPALGNAYYPPPNSTFRGERKDVTIDQVIAAIGPRTPAYPQTQREFRVLFVVLTDPSRELLPSDLEKLGTYRRQMEANFRLATGDRASVTTTFAGPVTPGSPRRRVAGK